MKKIFYIIAILFSLLSFACDDDDTRLYEPEEYSQQGQEEMSDNISDPSQSNVWDAILVIVTILGIAALIVYFFIALVPLKLWFQARLSKVKVSWFLLIKMKWKNIPQAKILNLLVKAKNAHVNIDPEELANHYLAHVDVDVVVDCMIRARNAKIQNILIEDLCTQYLAKVDVAAIIHALIMASNAKIEITINDLQGYYLAGVNVIDLIKAKIICDSSGYHDISLNDLKGHYLAGGNLEKTIEAYISAKKAGLTDFEFEDICAIDLANLDVTKAINSAITPSVVETKGVRGISRDGVELTLKVKVTLRSKIKSIIGGVSADTVLARVNEALATEIGRSENHYDVLENPYKVADKVEQQSQINVSSAFEILSVDISDIEVGNDVGANLNVMRAKAKAEDAKAELIVAEEKVQRAMAAAFLDGKITVKEYNDLQNTEADTKMRKSFTKPVAEEDNQEENKQ